MRNLNGGHSAEYSEGVVGVDEVGRGPLAGPLLVCALYLPPAYDMTKLAGVRDSKKLREEEREEWAAFAAYERKQGNLDWAFGWVSHTHIDSRGISKSIRRAVELALNGLDKKAGGAFVFLDGSLRAPEKFKQETIVKGDDTIPVISLAANIAKVARDKKMRLLARRYPEYGFDQHKGYGTRAHLDAIKKYGPCEIHRTSFLTNL